MSSGEEEGEYVPPSESDHTSDHILDEGAESEHFVIAEQEVEDKEPDSFME